MNIKLRIGLGLVGFAFVWAGFFGAVYAQESNVPEGPTDAQIQASGIIFPIPELGNCGDKQACKQYCENPANVEACVAFAEKSGLMNKEEAQRAKKFSQAVAKGGPGGCKSPGECEAYCSDITHLEECVSFAKKQGIKSRDLEQGERVLKHIKAGGTTPGGCKSEQECKTYCSDFSHAEECFEFAKKAGIIQAKGQARPGGPGPQHGDDDLSPEQFQKVMELAKKGETPGGCKSKEACEAYCNGPAHGEECVAFAEKAGFMSRDEAERIRKTGGKGPGGCSSPRACEAYCNDPANREACFKFAEEHGFISKEEVRRAKEGFVRVRAGLEHAPPEVAACLKSVVGPNVIEDIESGKLTPGPEIGERVGGCFEKFGHRKGPQDMFKDAPKGVIACIQEKLGDKFEKIKKGEEAPTPEIADTFRVCFQSVQFEKGGFFGEPGGPGGPGGEFRGQPGGPGQPGQGGAGRGFGRPQPHDFQRFLRTAPPQVASCFKEKLGANFEKLQNGELVEGLDPSVMRGCFEQFRPQEHFGPPAGGEGGPASPARYERGEQGGFPSGPGSQGFPSGEGQAFGRGGIPHEVLSCVKEKTGSEVTEEKLRGAESDRGSLGQAIRECFGKMQRPGQGSFAGEQGTKGGPQHGIPPEVLSCVKGKIGGEVGGEALRAGGGRGGAIGKAMQECFESLPGSRGGQGNFPGGKPDQRFGPPGNPQGQGAVQGRGPAPEPVLQCVKTMLGEAADLEKLRRGSEPSPEVAKAIGECYGKMEQGKNQHGGAPGQEGGRIEPGRVPPRPIGPPVESGQRPEQFNEQHRQQFNQQFNQQYNAEFQKQYQERFQGEVNRQMQGQFPTGAPGMPPQGGFPGQPGTPGQPGQYPMNPPAGFQPGMDGQYPKPPGGMQYPPQGMYPQPPQGTYPQPSQGTPPPPPPPSGESQPPPPPPQSSRNQPSLLGTIIAPFVNLLGGR
ncbi:MAG: hypothetical protein FJY98_02110 [Candidatus Liptonbacteria bacterium]|nr:hypothetical protein [Candidatus Liptonbacteria bacterium]